MPPSGPAKIELEAAIGYNGKVAGGLSVHPSNEYLVYPLGNNVVIKHLRSKKQIFLRGHSDQVTCVSVSRSGKYIASGQQSYSKADIILWDFEKALQVQDPKDCIYKRLKPLHRMKVQAIAFSADEKYMATLGGIDDNMLVLWDVETGKPRQWTPAHSESALTVAFYNNTSSKLLTGGYSHLRRWDFNLETGELDPCNVNLGTLSRIFKCIAVSEDDMYAYAGTSSGDLLEIKLWPAIPAFNRAGREMFSKGIRSVFCARGNNGPAIYLGNGDGSIVRLNGKTLKREAKGQATGAITSLSPVRTSLDSVVSDVYFGTDESNIYYCDDVEGCSLEPQLRASCHNTCINAVTFLKGFDSVFVTASDSDIRVWDARKQQELLRIRIPNVVCNTLCMSSSGHLILSGWSDGRIRAFKPVSGELEFVINSAHPDGVTAVAVTSDDQVIVSGGKGGMVRTWKMSTGRLIKSLKEHRGPVNSVTIRSDDRECISSSSDGSCLVFDIARGSRTQAMFASTMFRECAYHPDESQYLTCGSDRKLTYWDSYDGSAIRVLDGSEAEINSLDIDANGDKFVCGGNDYQLKLFDYELGELECTGDGHSGYINCVRISPEENYIVSVGAEGAIFVWKYPSKK